MNDYNFCTWFCVNTILFSYFLPWDLERTYSISRTVFTQVQCNVEYNAALH